MKKLRIFTQGLFLLTAFFSLTSSVIAYDATFPTIKLRQGWSYYFGDTFHAGRYDAGIMNLKVSFTEKGNFNRGANPAFPWTSEIVNKGYIVNANTSQLITWSSPRYQVIDHPIARSDDNLAIVYEVTYKERVAGAWTNQTTHTEYQPYTITWCGDGVRDDYYDSFNGNQITEICEPNDPARVGWGTGGCSATCQPITLPPVTTCDSLSVNPSVGNAPLSSNFSCSGTNANNYQIRVTQTGTPVTTFNTQTGNYNFTTAGSYQVQCFVNGTITSPACTKTVTVNPTPPAPSCDNLTVTPSSGFTGLTSSFNCDGTAATSYQVLVKKGASTVQTFGVKSGSYTFTSSGSYQVQCIVNGTLTSPACSKTVTVSDPAPKIYDLALRKTLVGTKTVFRQGDEVLFNITVFNQGELDAQNVTITDYIPGGLLLKGTNWIQVGNKATREYGLIPKGTSKTYQITLIIGTGALTGVVRNFAEISSDSGNDCDSIPDSTNGNQTGETDATGMIDNDIGNGCNPGGDEDDHDYAEITVEPTVVSIYDLALRKTLSPTTQGPFGSGSNVVFNIEVFNQGNVAANNIEVTDYIPTGLILNDSTWTQSGSLAKKTILKIEPGTSQILTIAFKIAANPPTNITNLAEISRDDGEDCDSTPDTNPTNDGTIVDNDIGNGCNPGGDEDDHDPETITTSTPSVYDLALRKTLSSTTQGPFSSGSTVVFNIDVFNQGNVVANAIQITDYIPTGLILDDANWIKSGNLAQKTIPTIAPNSSVRITIQFRIGINPQATITNYAEISIDDGDDCDSTPDTNVGNDGVVTDNAIGTGCEPGGDEDDHDLETISIQTSNIYDLALRKTLSPTTQGPFLSGSSITFNIEVFNQGNVAANNIEVTDYIPTGLLLSDVNWTQSGTLAKRTIPRIEVGSSQVLSISFVLAQNAPTTLTNFAEISRDDGDDCDSIPDSINGNQTGETILTGLINNAVGNGCEAGGDEDDHDIETITTGIIPPISACMNLSATPISGESSLTSNLVCTGSGGTSYRIEIKNSAGNIIQTLNQASGQVSLTTVGSYTASCFVNNEATTPSVCQKTLSVTPPGGSSGGPTPVCNDIITNSPGNYTCFGNQYTSVFAMQCGTNTDGSIKYLGPKDALASGEAGGRKIAQFSCNEGIPRCYSAFTGATISQITNTSVWFTSEACTIQTAPICGDGVINQTTEQCDMGVNNGKPGFACSATCTLGGGGSSSGGSSSGGSSSGGSSSSSSGGNPSCTIANGCISTTPNGGELLFGPVGNLILGQNKNPITEKGQRPYLFNNSDYDLSFDALCIKKTSGDESIFAPEVCKNLGNRMIYAYERIEMSDASTATFKTNKVPNSLAYGSGVITTSVKDGGISYYNAYFAGDLNVRVAKPAVTTVGGGVTYVDNTQSKIGDLQKVTSGLTGYENNKNFVGTSVGTGKISSYTQEIDTSGSIDKTQNDKKTYTDTVKKTLTGSTSSVGAVILTSFNTKYNGIENVFIIKDKNVRLSSFSAPTKPTTYIVENGNLLIDTNIISNTNIAFVVKAGDIIIDTAVTKLDGTYIAIPLGTTGGNIKGNGDTSTQLVFQGSVYGDMSQLVDQRYYISKSSTSGMLGVGTIVSFGSSIFHKPAPLVGQFIGEYLDTNKVAR